MRSLLNAVSLTIATGFGLGILPTLLPLEKLGLPSRWTGAGFLGSLLGFGMVLAGFPLQFPNALIFLLSLTLLALWSGECAENYWQIKDNPRIISDEVAGYLWSVVFLPVENFSSAQRLFIFMGAFVLFRIFDVCKWPLASVQKIRGGWGILLDDLLAGASVNIILQITLRLFF